MKIAGIEKLSLVDFDGYVSATVFTPGCNFKCGFCHNSPLVVSSNNLQLLDESEVLDYLEKRFGILEGLCISGGEPTLQKGLDEFCAKVKNLGYKIKLDTNGTNPEMVKFLWESKLVDYFAMDIKNDKASYAKIIGFDSYDTCKIEQTIDYFLKNGVDCEFRTTLINEFHKEQNIFNIGKWIKGAKKYCLQKFKDVGSCISSQGLSPVDKQTAERFVSIVKDDVLSVKLRGYDV